MIRGFLSLLFGGWLSLATLASAADVSIDVSSRETYVDLPVILHIRIEDPASQEAPVIPEVDGLRIQSAGPPSRNTQISVINGQTAVNTSSLTFPYRVTPTRPGTFTIPPIQITSGGQRTMTKAVQIVATKSETNDLLFVEISGAKKKVFVGQATTLTLKIWIRPYKSKVHNVTLDEADMWSLLSDQTTWGPFESRMQELADERKRPGGEGVIRKDSDGNEHEYYLYEIDATIYPDRPGRIDGSDVRIVFDYPESLGRGRSPFSLFDDDSFFSSRGFRGFGSRLTVTKVRPVVAETAVDDLEIHPIPTAGRPSDYRGAVGKYTIKTEASPSVVQAGDPITLRIDIGGSGPIDLVRAPPLAETSELTDNFKVADDSLSGIVSDAGKRFTTTIRPKRPGITQIPAIGITYFDPDQEEFVTARSRPIAIQVTAADQLDLANIVGGSTDGSGRNQAGQSPANSTANTDGAPPAAAVWTDIGRRPSKPPAPMLGTGMIAFLVVPPLFACVALLLRIGRALPNAYFMEQQFKRSVDRADSIADIAEATQTYLCKKFAVADDVDRRAHSVGALRGRGHSDLAIRVERLYNAARYPQRADDDVVAWRQEATQVISELNSRRHRRLTPSAAMIVLAVCGSSLGAEETAVNTDQSQSIFRAAIDRYQAADYRSAEQKFQQLVDQGIKHDLLFYNLGLSCEQQGKLPQAIANYRRALRIEPERPEYHQRLSGLDRAQTIDLPRRIIGWTFVASWLTFWIAVTYSIFQRNPWVLGIGCCASVVTLASGAVRLHDRYEFTRDNTVVIVDPELTIRDGDGEEFEVIRKRSNLQGSVATTTGERAGWSKIQLPDGMAGWVKSESLAAID